MTPTPKAKLYCHVDETGQDPASSVFVVVVAVSAENQDVLRQALMDIEDAAGTGRRKWHKSRSERRLRYLRLVLLADMWAGCIRAALGGSQEEAKMLDAALNLHCIWSLGGLPQKRKTP